MEEAVQPADCVVTETGANAASEIFVEAAVNTKSTAQTEALEESNKTATETDEAKASDCSVDITIQQAGQNEHVAAAESEPDKAAQSMELADRPEPVQPTLDSESVSIEKKQKRLEKVIEINTDKAQLKKQHGFEPVINMECETIKSSALEATNDQPGAAVNISSGLSLLATYDSDADTDAEGITLVEQSDTEDVVEVPAPSAAISSSLARRQVVTVSSGSDSSSSDSHSDSEGEYLTVLRNKIDKRINTQDCDDDDDDCEDDARPRRRQPPKVRGELLLDELPPIHQLEITVPEDECVELGKVHSIVDQLVLVSVLPNSMLFDLDTVLFLEKGRKVLGQVFDVLGQVADPLYCVRFNTNQQIKDSGINIGDVVYCAPQTEHTQFVILSKLMQVRGSDASWEHDVEPPARFIDYSDDEAEREARSDQRKRRQGDRTNSTDSVETVATVTTEASEPAPSRQRGRRAQRESRPSSNYQQNGNIQQYQPRSQSRDSQYNYHPSFNPGSWHSNYYHNYQQPAANFNMMAGMPFPMPPHGYGYGHMPPPPQHPYAIPPPMPMNIPPHMYPSQPSPYGPPTTQHQPPNTGG